MAEAPLTEEELRINHLNVENFNQTKSKLFENIDIVANKINTSGIRPDIKDRIRNELGHIITISRTTFVHYKEKGFLEVIDKEMGDILKLINDGLDNEKIENILDKIRDLRYLIENYSVMKNTFRDLSINVLGPVIQEVNEELTSFRRLRNISDNARTENIYDNAVTKYRDLEKSYRLYFYGGMGVLLCLSVGLLTLKQELVPHLFSTVEFWAVKISLLLVGITLISYFLKQSAHYQRLADQNYQTQVELQAYPSFMESIPSEEAASVRKELALKYFGREVDGAAHKDMGNLVSDQMKSTTEMVKATTEAIKNLKG
ncbi:hypothetical protein [Acinetobacter baumannii]|uniref:hypothetical protein n=1 Tax=Acinetobacter baumannii TaxID=470 RepID=UPI001127120B|nr:hypothetical protein [Acinetobacter baumannii]TPU21218.1 hypothetical protein FJU87_07830 [Acinetobacter baumannii]